MVNNMLYVCKKCHEQDARSINCGWDFDRHDIMMMGNCEICGLYGTIILCAMYEVYGTIVLCAMYEVSAKKERDLNTNRMKGIKTVKKEYEGDEQK